MLTGGDGCWIVNKVIGKFKMSVRSEVESVATEAHKVAERTSAK